MRIPLQPLQRPLLGLLLTGLAVGAPLLPQEPEATPEDPAEPAESADATPAEPVDPGETILVRAELLHLRAGETLENAQVLVRDGVIVDVGTDLEAPEGATELTGKVVCAGFVDPWSTLGLDPMVVRSTDSNAATRAVDGLDPFDFQAERQEALAAGVTTVGVAGGARANVGGIGAAVHVALGDAPGDEVLLPDAFLGLSVGLSGDVFDRINHADRLGRELEGGRKYREDWNEYRYELEAWEAEIAKLEEKLEKDFKKAKKDREKDLEEAKEKGKEFKEKSHKEDKKPRMPKFDAEKAVWARVVTGELPLVAEVHRLPELRALLDTVAPFTGVRLVLAGCSGADPVAEELAKKRIPVIVYPAPAGSSAPEPVRGSDLGLAGRLEEAGVRVLIGSGGGSSRDLPLLAALAVGHGLDREAAFEALTEGGARVLDLGGKVGRVQRGYQADLLVLDGDPLATTTRTLYVLSGGRIVHDSEND